LRIRGWKWRGRFLMPDGDQFFAAFVHSIGVLNYRRSV
jgi:hypothetical protein